MQNTNFYVAANDTLGVVNKLEIGAIQEKWGVSIVPFFGGAR